MLQNKVALITGANGQDGYFLSKHLKRAGVGTIVGIVQPCESPDRVTSAPKNLIYFDEIVPIDLMESEKLAAFVVDLKPDYLLNFGAIAGSLDQLKNPKKLLDVNLGAVATMLEAIKTHELKTLFVQASSSETFAGGGISPQDLNTPRVPRTIYGTTKIAADNLVKVYRDIFKLNCFSLILYSHESPLRNDTFFTKKVILQAFDVKEGKVDKAIVYTPLAVRDWGYAGDYCKEIVAKVLKGEVRDQIIATGNITSVRRFAQLVFKHLGINYDEHVDEISTFDGRAPEETVMVADYKAIPTRFAEKNTLDINNLVKLLVRYEKFKRSQTK